MALINSVSWPVLDERRGEAAPSALVVGRVCGIRIERDDGLVHRHCERSHWSELIDGPLARSPAS
jgi:hypothetical protein